MAIKLLRNLGLQQIRGFLSAKDGRRKAFDGAFLSSKPPRLMWAWVSAAAWQTRAPILAVVDGRVAAALPPRRRAHLRRCQRQKPARRHELLDALSGSTSSG